LKSWPGNALTEFDYPQTFEGLLCHLFTYAGRRS